MNLLEDLLEVLDGTEARGFVQYLRMQQGKEGNLEEQLSVLLREKPGISGDEVCNALYGTPNKLNAYHSLRKRLQKKLVSYMTIATGDKEEEKQRDLEHAVLAAARLLEGNKFDSAGKMLGRLKQQASRHENYRAGLDVLKLEISYSDELGLDHDALVSEWREMQHLSSIQERVDLAYSVLRIKLREVRLTGHLSSLDKLVRQELDALGIDLNHNLSVSVVYRMLDIIRMAIIAAKEYHQFEPLVTVTYAHIEQNGTLQPGDIKHRIGFAYMIAHAKFRTRKFKEANYWNEQIKWLFSQSNQPFVRSYISRYYLLKAAISNYQGRGDQAAAVLEYAMERPEMKTSERLNLHLANVVYLMQNAEFKKAHKAMLKIDLNDRQCEQHMGKEWRCKKNMIEVVLFVELNHIDLAMSRIRSMHRYFRGFFNDPFNKWMELFLKAVVWIVDNPDGPFNDEIADRLQAVLERWPQRKEDLHALAFYCWLKSKMERRSFRDTLNAYIADTGTPHQGELTY